jgi:hypothetical protein
MKVESRIEEALPSSPHNAHRRALVIAPLASDATHLGARRVQYFCRWLIQAGFATEVLCADGSVTGASRVIPVGDPLGVWKDPVRGQVAAVERRRGGTGLGRRLLVPDPSVVWSAKVALSPIVLRAAKSASLIITSGPPESPHIAGAILSRRTGTPHWVDYRDGWIDEPLKSELESCGWRRAAEVALENFVLRSAAIVTVSSDGWRDALERRHPELSPRLRVLRNPVPSGVMRATSALLPGRRPKLLYMGRLEGSRQSQCAEPLLELLEYEAASRPGPFEVQFRGGFLPSELNAIGRFADRVSPLDWCVRIEPPVSYGKALQEIAAADGLLCLSNSKNAIPSKLFDYLGAGRPILCLAAMHGAAWNICSGVPQAWLVDVTKPRSKVGFCKAVKSPVRGLVPETLTEVSVAADFGRLIAEVVK